MPWIIDGRVTGHPGTQYRDTSIYHHVAHCWGPTGLRRVVLLLVSLGICHASQWPGLGSPGQAELGRDSKVAFSLSRLACWCFSK